MTSRLDEASRAALRTKLVPWLGLLTASPPTFTLTRDGCVDSSVTIALAVDVKDSLKQDAGSIMSTPQRYPTESPPRERRLDDLSLRNVREAIDLVYMALSLDVSLLWSQEHDVKPPPFVERVLTGAGSFVLQVTLNAQELKNTVMLKRRLCEYFVETLDRRTSGKTAFQRLRHELEIALEAANPTWRTRVVTQPVVVRYSISTSEELQVMPYAMEDYMRHIVDFITYAAALERPPWTHQEDTTRLSPPHLPLIVDRINLTINQFLITHQIAQLVAPLHTVRAGFVCCERVQVDPRMTQCTAKDVTAFVSAVIAGCDGKTFVATGPQSHRVIDDFGEDRTEVCAVIIRGIACCDTEEFVDFGGLAVLFQSAASRRAIYRAMLEHTFSRSSPCSVSFDHAAFGQLDAQLLREEHVTWKSKNPGGKLRLSKLLFYARDHTSKFLAALVDALDEIEELHIHDKSYYPHTYSEEIVRSAFTKFTGLRKFVAENIDISSMAMFLEARETPLEKLALSDFALADRESFVHFTRALGDPENPLARSLQTLVIGGRYGHIDGVDVTPEEVNELAQTLQTNDVLSIVKIYGNAHLVQMLATSTRLCETSGRMVRARRRGRQIAAVKAGRVAFLSAVHAQENSSSALAALDASVVKLVFAFAAAGVERQVILETRRRRE